MSEELETTKKGIIEYVKPGKTPKGKDTYGIKIQGEWYNGWGTSPWQKGEEAEFTFVQNGNYKNVKHVLNTDNSTEDKKYNVQPVGVENIGGKKNSTSKPTTMGNAVSYEAMQMKREQSILRQVFLKCSTQIYASIAKEGSTSPEDLINFAKGLERAWKNWDQPPKDTSNTQPSDVPVEGVE